MSRGGCVASSNHLFSSDSLSDTQGRWTPDLRVLEKQSNTQNGTLQKQRKSTSLPENPPLNKCFFQNLPIIRWNALNNNKKELPFFIFFICRCFYYAHFSFSVLFSLSDKSYLQYCHYFFSGDCLSWILESHRLEMSKCKTVIDLWDVMRIHPGVGFVIFRFLFQ